MMLHYIPAEASFDMLEKRIDCAKYSSIRIGGILHVKIAQNLHEALDLHKQGHFIVGKMNNLLINDSKTHRIYQLGKEFDYIKDLRDTIEVGASCSSRKIYLHAKKNNLGGFEFLGALPGSIGGIVRMNAGMKTYEIKDSIHSVCINGEWQKRENIHFTYRDSRILGVITAVRFYKKRPFCEKLDSLFKQMRQNQPLEPSCGSCFKNPPQNPAGKLLDMVHLRGFSYGRMAFSQKHANFLINTGGGTFSQALFLINLAKELVLEKFSIALENEIVILE